MARVSVIVPNYNHATYLAHRLDSIYEQSYRDFEVIILDDASSDRSLDIIDRYADRPRTRVIVNAANSGSVFRQWARGVAAGDSEFVWIAESDDSASQGLLSDLVHRLEQNPTLAMAYAQSWMIDRDGRITGDAEGWTSDIDARRWSQPFVNDGIDEIRRCLTVKNTVPNASAVVFRRATLVEAGGVITEPMRLCGDWMQWVRLLRHGGIAYSPQRLNFWRQATSNARHRIDGILEWEEGSRVLDEACAAIRADAHETLRIKHRFLLACWEWQRRSAERLLLATQEIGSRPTSAALEPTT